MAFLLIAGVLDGEKGRTGNGSLKRQMIATLHFTDLTSRILKASFGEFHTLFGARFSIGLFIGLLLKIVKNIESDKKR